MLLTTNFRLVDALQRVGYDSNEAIARSDRIMSRKAEDAVKHDPHTGQFTAGSGNPHTDKQLTEAHGHLEKKGWNHNASREGGGHRYFHESHPNHYVMTGKGLKPGSMAWTHNKPRSMEKERNFEPLERFRADEGPKSLHKHLEAFHGSKE